jgi:hypothetical protein
MTRLTNCCQKGTSTSVPQWCCLVLGGFFFLSACHRKSVPEAAPVNLLPVDAVPLSQLDLGASMLAAVDNARFAIRKGDPVAAANDLNQALSYARRLPDRPSRLLRSEPRAMDRNQSSRPGAKPIPPAQLTDFGALVKLASSRAELDEGKLDDADAQLRAIQDGIPQSEIPSDLPLLRAAGSLDSAHSAAKEGRTSDLKTQLLCAELALSVYTGPAHLAEAHDLAATIGQTLDQSGPRAPILEYRVNVWLGNVVGLAGGGRWDAAPR